MITKDRALMKQTFKNVNSATHSAARQENEKIIIAHRGASGYLPEHTLEAKAMAYANGADYLEQDLVFTKDNKLIVLHDRFLDRTTNVADIFPKRARPDGRYYAIDFTLNEIRKLKFTEGFEIVNGQKVQIYPKRFPMGKSVFHIHTFEEEIEFIQGLNFSTGKNVGLYTEIKAPWFHKKEGRDITLETLKTLKKYGYGYRSDKVFIQIFDFQELKRIKTILMPELKVDFKLIQLIAQTDWHETYEQLSDGSWQNYDYSYLLSDVGLKELSQYADGIGPDYHMLINPLSKSYPNIKFTELATIAHKYNLLIHPYTLRLDNLPSYVKNIDELFSILFCKAKVDGVFTDFPNIGVKFLTKKGLRKKLY